MIYLNRDCVDLGTENCPCILAESRDCIVCTRLAGEEHCDCNWSGLCIYNEFYHGGNKARNKREDIIAHIIDRKPYGKDYILLTIRTEGDWLLKAENPGTFLMVRNSLADSMFNTPLSVMEVDFKKNQIKLLVRIISAKTKSLMKEGDELIVRGIYRNGLLGEGLRSLEKTGRWLMVSRGAAFVSGINMIEWSGGRAEVDFIVDLSEDCGCLAEEYVKGRARIVKRCLDDIIESDVDGRLDFSKYSHIILLMSDYYREALVDKLNIPSEKLIYSNNYHICCGEGICGACSTVEQGGRTRKMCKARGCE